LQPLRAKSRPLFANPHSPAAQGVVEKLPIMDVISEISADLNSKNKIIAYIPKANKDRLTDFLKKLQELVTDMSIEHCLNMLKKDFDFAILEGNSIFAKIENRLDWLSLSEENETIRYHRTVFNLMYGFLARANEHTMSMIKTAYPHIEMIKTIRQLQELYEKLPILADMMAIGSITKYDLLKMLGNHIKESSIGDILYIKDNIGKFKDISKLTASQARTLGYRFAGAISELANIGLTIYSFATAIKAYLKMNGSIKTSSSVIKNTKASGTKLKSTPELENHIKYHDTNTPRKNGIGGAHNSKEFFKSDVKIVSRKPHPKVDGVEIIEYQLPKLDKAGKVIPGEYQNRIPRTKTVYDPNIISDETFISRGLEAANDALSKSGSSTLPHDWTGVDNQGVTWKGYYENGSITSFFPD